MSLHDNSFFLGRLGFSAIVAGGLLALSVAALKKFKDDSLSWKIVIISWAVVVGCVFSTSLIKNKERDFTRPISTLNYEGVRTTDLALRDGWAYVIFNGGLSVVDLRDPSAPREVGRTEVPLWNLGQMTISGSSVYALGQLKSIPSDSIGVVVFDISTPENPQYRGHTAIGSAREIRQREGIFTQGENLYVGLIDLQHAKLLSFELGEDGMPRLQQDFKVEKVEETSTEHENLIWDYEMRKYRLDIEVAGHHAFLATYSGLVVIDLSNPRQLAEVGRLEFEDLEVHSESRYVSIDGDRLYIQRFWPSEVAIMDIGNPRQPVEIGALYRGGPGSAIVDGYLYSYSHNWNIWASEIQESGLTREVEEFSTGKEESDIFYNYSGNDYRNVSNLIVDDNHIYVLMRNHLVVYPDVKKAG